VVVKEPGVYGVFLTLFTLLLAGRVAGQLIVYLYAPRWLPPMEEWQSGLLPYPVLLASQGVVLTFMTLICVDFLRGHGFFVEPHPRGGVFSIWFACVYLAGMVVRYHHLSLCRRRIPLDLGTVPELVNCRFSNFPTLLASSAMFRSPPRVS
jgi:hypothetical protein